MNKEDVVHIYNGIWFSHKKEQNNATWNNMDGPRDYHTKWSKSEKEIPYDITDVWNLNITQMNLSMKEKQTHKHREQTCDCQGEGGGEKWIRNLGLADASYHTEKG